MMTRTQIRQKIYLARIAGLLEPHIARFLTEFLENTLLRRCGRRSRWSSPPIKICGIDRANSVGGPRYLVYCLTPKTRRDILIQKKSFFLDLSGLNWRTLNVKIYKTQIPVFCSLPNLQNTSTSQNKRKRPPNCCFCECGFECGAIR